MPLPIQLALNLVRLGWVEDWKPGEAFAEFVADLQKPCDPTDLDQCASAMFFEIVEPQGRA